MLHRSRPYWRAVSSSAVSVLFVLAACSGSLDGQQDQQIDQPTELSPQGPNAQPSADLEETARIEPTTYPTHTPRPPIAPTPEPAFDRGPKGIQGAILDTASGFLFSFPEITLTNVGSYMSIGYDEAAAGSVFIVIDLAMRNPGDTIAYLGGAGFQVFDDNGVSHDPEYAIVDCRLEKP